MASLLLGKLFSFHTVLNLGMFGAGPIVGGFELSKQQDQIDEQAKELQEQLVEYKENMNKALQAEQELFTETMAEVAAATRKLRLAQTAMLESQQNYVASFSVVQFVGFAFVALIALTVILKLSGLLGLPLKQRVLMLEQRQAAITYFAEQQAAAAASAASSPAAPAAAPAGAA